MRHAVKVYGTSNCPKTRHALSALATMGVGCDYFDLDTDRHAAAWVRWKSPQGQTPVVLAGLAVLTDPSDQQLQAVAASSRQFEMACG